MSKEHVDKCKNIAQQAMGMNSPCIQITPVFPNTHIEWAKLYHIFSQLAKKAQIQIDQPFLVSIAETGSNPGPQCPESDNGFHEYTNLDDEVLSVPTMVCIHCGDITRRTARNKKDVLSFLENKKYEKLKKIEPNIDTSKY